MEPFRIERMQNFGDELAVGEATTASTYANILERLQFWRDKIANAKIQPGEAVSVEGEYSAEAISVFLALLENDNIIVPLTEAAASQHETFREIAGIEKRIALDEPDAPIVDLNKEPADNELYGALREKGAAGLVLFTSGSTGASKAVVHDLDVLLEKYHKQRQKLRTIVFLQLDHIGGVNTLFYTLANGGAVVVPGSRAAGDVCGAVEKYQAQLLPTSPTFLNLLLLSGEHEKHDLSSLTLITYGTEPMPESTLRRTNAAFPEAKLQQTYGSTELGILASRSRNDSSLWVSVGGKGYETKIVDGTLRVRAQTAMLGYLNAPSPFDEDGFVDTGDRVEVDGEWIKILGRESEIINVGGSKVHPAEVESVLLDLDEIEDASVSGKPHPILGQIVTARVQLTKPMTAREVKQLIRKRCQDSLPTYAMPVKLEISETALYNARFKRQRK